MREIRSVFLNKMIKKEKHIKSPIKITDSYYHREQKNHHFLRYNDAKLSPLPPVKLSISTFPSFRYSRQTTQQFFSHNGRS